MEAGLPIRNVSNQDCAAVIDTWLRRDWTVYAIASVVGGISPNTIKHWLESRRVGRPILFGPVTADAIWAARDRVPRSGHVGATVAIRQLQALAWMCWGTIELTRRSGGALVASSLICTRNGVSYRGNAVRHISASKANAIDALYNELNNQKGPNPEARRAADLKCWPPPAAWDDITDLDEFPKSPTLRRVADLPVDMVAVEARLTGHKDALGEHTRLTQQERRQVVALGILRGMTLKAIEERTGLNPLAYRYNLDVATPETTQLYAVHTGAGWSYHDELQEAC